MTVIFQVTASLPTGAACLACKKRNLHDPRGKPRIVAHGPIEQNTWTHFFRKYIPLFRSHVETLTHHMHEPCLKALMQRGDVACPSCSSTIDKSSVFSWKERAVEWKEKRMRFSIRSFVVITSISATHLGFSALLSWGASFLPVGRVAQGVGAVAVDKLLTIALSHSASVEDPDRWIETALYQVDWKWAVASINGRVLASQLYYYPNRPDWSSLPFLVKLASVAAAVSSSTFGGVYGQTGMIVANLIVCEKILRNMNLAQ